MPASSVLRRKGRAIDALVWFHRWLGVATCLIFALWFASGAVMVFKPFPSLARGEQMALQNPVRLSAVAISPVDAIAAAGGNASALRLVERAGDPAYIVETATGLVAVDARTVAVLPLVGREAAQAVAARLFGPRAQANAPFAYDQWVVHNRFDPLRPFYRLNTGDAAGTELYLSARTGEVVQRTTRSERAWNWVGAVLHWVYFTPLRSSFTAWDRSVWLLSLIAMLVAVAGTVLGLVRTVAAAQQAAPSLSYFRGRWMRWHHIVGLFVSPIVLAWIFSGWLSMDHGRLFSRGQATSAQLAAFHGRSLRQSLAGVDVSSWREMPGAVELDFDVIGGDPVVLATDRDGEVTGFDRKGRVLGAGALVASARRGIAAAWPDARVVSVAAVRPDNVYALAEGWPSSTVAYSLAGADAPSIYVDGANGRLLTVMSESRANYAWFYYALHTFQFPVLIARPVLRQTIVLVLMLAGLMFSLTGVVIGIRRLRNARSSRARNVANGLSVVQKSTVR